MAFVAFAVFLTCCLRSLAITEYSSLALLVLFRVPSCLSCRRPQTTIAFLGVLLFFAISVLESTVWRASRARLMFRPQCFSHSRRFAPLAPCKFVSPHYHVQDFSSGAFPDNQPAKLSPARTLMSLALQAAPRLQGLVQLPIRSTCVSFTLRRSRSPPEFLLPRVFLNAPCNAFTLLRS